MTVYKNLPSGFVLKERPGEYVSDGMTVGGNKGFVISRAPKEYPITAQQLKVRNVARECGIHKGMDRASLRKAMIDCVGPKLEKK